jgi:hypothetical protein
VNVGWLSLGAVTLDESGDAVPPLTARADDRCDAWPGIDTPTTAATAATAAIDPAATQPVTLRILR